jgi:hypothetical protein
VSRATRLALVVGLSLAVIVAVAVGATAAAVYRAGSITVDVRSEDGTDLSIAVPAGLADLVITLVPLAPLREYAVEAEPLTEELWEVWQAIERPCRELAEAPDFTIVEISGPGERVLVRKQGRRLVTDITTEGERIHVVVPLRTVQRVLKRLG